jgi:hypothetical protein
LLTNVHVTLSPGLSAMFETGLPSLQVAEDWAQPLGNVSDTE